MERVSSTKTGITKLMITEGGNFPELAAFYQREVVRPAHELVRRVLQRGIDRGEFAPLDLDHALYAVVAPMMFLMLARHSVLACVDDAAALDPALPRHTGRGRAAGPVRPRRPFGGSDGKGALAPCTARRAATRL